MPKSKISFEEALARLEQISDKLDAGDASLDDSLALFGEGVSLIKLCNSMLDSAEQKVKILVDGENGKTEEDFTSKNE